MALSRITKIAPGGTNTFAVSFALGYGDEADVTARVGAEVDGLGAPVYRTIDFSVPGFMTLSGPTIAATTPVVFERTESRWTLDVDWSDGANITDENLNAAQLQSLRLVQEALDGRFEGITQDIDMVGHRIVGLPDPTDADEAATKGYADTKITDGAANAAAAAASAAAALASQGSSATSAGTASTQAGIATTQAGIAAGAAASVAGSVALISTALQPTTGVFNQTGTGKFSTDQTPAPRIHHMADRLFLDGAAPFNGQFADGNITGISPLTKALHSWGPRDASMFVDSSVAGMAIVGQSQSSKSAGWSAYPGNVPSSIGVSGFTINDASNGQGWGGYFDAVHMTGANFTVALESTVANFEAGNLDMDPYNIVTGVANSGVNQWVASGSGLDLVQTALVAAGYSCHNVLHAAAGTVYLSSYTLGSPSAWAQTHAYAVGDLVLDNETDVVYRCLVAHTSGAVNMAADRTAHTTYWRARPGFLRGTIYGAGSIGENSPGSNVFIATVMPERYMHEWVRKNASGVTEISAYVWCDNIPDGSAPVGLTFKQGRASVDGIVEGVGVRPGTAGDPDVNTNGYYGKGSFTPNLQFGGAAVGMTGTFIGRYTRNGDVVFIEIDITLTAKGSSTGSATITGLPFPSASSAGIALSVIPQSMGASMNVVGALISASSSTIALTNFAAGALSLPAATDFTNTTRLYISGSYKVS